jgi:hypothetical protein
MKRETNHLFDVLELHTLNLLLVLVRFAAAMRNIKALAACDPKATKVCVNIPATAAVPVVVCCRGCGW